MRLLLLLRHAEAEAGPPGLPDRERALTAAGTAHAAGVGRFLADAGMPPDVALCSDARRARETLAALAGALPGRLESFIEQELYHADAEGLLEQARLHGGRANRLLVVGHNPAIALLALALARQAPEAKRDRLRAGYPAAGLAIFRSEAADWTGFSAADAELLRFVAPSP